MYWAFQIRDLGLYTEFLESLDWDEDRMEDVVTLVAAYLNKLEPAKFEIWMPDFKREMAQHLNLRQVKVLEKIIKLEIEKFIAILNAPEA